MVRSKKTARSSRKSPKSPATKPRKKRAPVKAAARKARPAGKKIGKKTAARAAKKTAKKKAVGKKTVVRKPAKPAVRKKKILKKTVKRPVKKKTIKKTVKKKAIKKPAKKKTVKKPVKKRIVKKVVKKVARKPVRKTVKKVTRRTPGKKILEKKTVRKVRGKTPGKAPAPAPVKEEPPKRPVLQEEYRAYGFYDGVLVCENPKVFPRRTPYSKKEIETLCALLLRERTRLREVLRDLDQLTFNLGAENPGPVPGYSIHLAEDATQNVDTETALLLRRDEEGALVQVEAAIERLADGVYGVCMGCGSKIGMQRLKVVPETHLCMTCKRTYDKASSNH